MKTRPDICPACGEEFMPGTFDQCGESILEQLHKLKREAERSENDYKALNLRLITLRENYANLEFVSLLFSMGMGALIIIVIILLGVL